METTSPDLVVLDTEAGISDALFYRKNNGEEHPVPCLFTFSEFPLEIDICGRCPYGCLKKPFGIKELLAKVRQIISQREQLGECVCKH